MTNSKRDVKAPEDLKGLKMRTMENPVHVAAYKGFGIITTPMAFPEVFTALQQGTVDGQENPLSVIISAKFDQVQKHLSLTGHVYSPAIFVMNKGAFDKLSAADKQAFIDAAREGTKANRARVDEDDAKGVADLRAKGMTVIDTIDKAKFVSAWRRSTPSSRRTSARPTSTASATTSEPAAIDRIVRSHVIDLIASGARCTTQTGAFI
jgi:TRAP-type C4-dicarboxylate transport system substrate-binding protein